MVVVQSLDSHMERMVSFSDAAGFFQHGCITSFMNAVRGLMPPSHAASASFELLQLSSHTPWSYEEAIAPATMQGGRDHTSNHT